MERRNWSLKALEELKLIDSKDDFERASALITWVERYIPNDQAIFQFDLEEDDASFLLELFFKNIEFMKKHREKTKEQLTEMRNVRKFIPNAYH